MLRDAPPELRRCPGIAAPMAHRRGEGFAQRNERSADLLMSSNGHSAPLTSVPLSARKPRVPPWGYWKRTSPIRNPSGTPRGDRRVTSHFREAGLGCVPVRLIKRARSVSIPAGVARDQSSASLL